MRKNRKRPPVKRTAFGERLRGRRKELGLSQTDLAEAIGASQRIVAHYESQAGPPLPALAKIATVLEISTDELLGLGEPKPTREPDEDPEVRRLWKKFRQILSLPENDQRAIIRVVNALVVSSQK